MDNKNSSNKKKVTIKANTKLEKKLILTKAFITNDKQKILVLKNIYKKKEMQNIAVKNNHPEIKILNSNIININGGKNLNDKILEIKKITKSLGGKPILKGISFSLGRGQILGLLGPNGAGKSTLFSLIVGKIFAEQGEIRLNNEVIDKLPIHKRALKGISLLEQHKGLFENMTAYENLYAILELYLDDKNKIETKILQLLSYFGLQYLSDVKARNMSGGEYKKISTLQRICNKDIKILLLDEPMAALDPLSISSIKKFILELREMGLSVIITDHNFFAIQDILDNCIIIRDGQVMVEGPPKNIMKDEKAIKYYLGTGFKI